MNASGLAVASLQRFYKVPLSDLIVVYDDLDLPQGKLRLRPDGGHGGHNGMRSIIEQLGSTAFPRLRIGIGRPPGHMDPVDYVLQDFSADEEAYMEEVRERAVRALECWLQDGIVAAMNRYNTNGAMGEGKG
jgi:PTH1 family peptidyl-tRNA hydrolase